ncbi:GntR family transcriptional regulator [Streptomyces hypolithicus]
MDFPQGRSRSGFPRYAEVADAVQADIETGRIATGARLPAERDLARQHGVNRQTVRESLRLLREKGLVSTDRRGTVVRNDRSDRGDRSDHARGRSFHAATELLFPLGALTAEPGSRSTTSLGWEAVPDSYATQLGIPPKARTLVHQYTATSPAGVVTLSATSYLSHTAITQVPLLARYRRHLPHHSRSDLRRLYQWMVDSGLTLEHYETLTLAPGTGAEHSGLRLLTHRQVRDQHHRTLELTRLTHTPSHSGVTYRFTAPAQPAPRPA